MEAMAGSTVGVIGADGMEFCCTTAAKDWPLVTWVVLEDTFGTRRRISSTALCGCFGCLATKALQPQKFAG